MTMIESTCPWCNQPVEDVNAESDAERFCSDAACGKPLFMKPSVPRGGPGRAPSAAGAVAEGYKLTDDPSRRRPRVEGVGTTAMIECPHCKEQNKQTASTCHRCFLSLTLEPSKKDTGSVKSNTGCAGNVNAVVDRPFKLPEWILISLGVVLIALLVRLVIVI